VNLGVGLPNTEKIMSKRSDYIAKRKKLKLAKISREIRRDKRPKKIKLFIDESNNSGLRLFEGKREFLCCGLFLKNGKTIPNSIDKIIHKIEGNELHGSKLGLTKIETIAVDLLQIYKTIEATFLFSVIDKHYFAAMKLWDCLFDASTNPGVSGIHVSMAPLRYILIAKFCHVVYENPVVKEFWEIHTSIGERNYDVMLKKLIQVIKESTLDSRSKELIEMAVQGALSRPQDVFGDGAIKEDSPNVTAVVMMAHELNKVYSGKNVEISEILHDRQDEFGLNIETLFNAAKQVNTIWGVSNPFPRHEKSKVIPGNIRISRTSCHELDLCDIACYLAMKSITTDLTGSCRELLCYIEEHSYPIYMTDRGLSEIAEMHMANAMSLPISAAGIERGKKFSEMIDQSRVDRLRNSFVERR
jgi:hypothetical protein